MEGRMGLLFLILLGAAWACDVRELPNPELNRKSDVCALCEEYSAEALDYLKDNKTRTEIIDTLHNTCLQLLSFKQQCIELVDYYAQLFFIEIDSIKPGELCKKFYLCQSAKISSRVQGNSCDFCKDTVAALLAKLSDPDTKCKRVVLEYGPLVLVNAEKFLRTEDICTALHACPGSTIASQEPSIMEEIPLLSDS